jgi:hypothetical protein
LEDAEKNENEATAMNKLRIVPMAAEIAERVRQTMKAPGYGFPAHRETAAGRAPCRQCLKLIKPAEEELILFTYDAFHDQGVAPMPGPVYVHAKSCEEYAGEGRVPEEYRGQPLTFEAFGVSRERTEERRVTGDEETALQELFERQETQYVHVRSTSAGCYLFRVERER